MDAADSSSSSARNNRQVRLRHLAEPSAGEAVKRDLTKAAEELRDQILQRYDELARAGQVNLASLQREFGVHEEIVRRCVFEPEAVRGRPGSPRHLTDAGEAAVLAILEKLASSNIVVTFTTVSKIAADIFNSDCTFRNQDARTPTFSSAWFRGLKQRYPAARIESKHVEDADRKRFNASTPSKVRTALRSLKVAVSSVSTESDGWVDSSRVYFADETDVTPSGHGAGLRTIMIAGSEAENLDSETQVPHTSLLPFASLAGSLFMVFIKSGGANISGNATHDDTYPHSTIIFNPSGSAEVNKDGLIGSYYEAIALFVANVRRYDDEIEDPPKRILIVDGCKPHVQHDVERLLKENNIKLFVLGAHLTHLVQLQDSPNIFGHLKGHLRQHINQMMSSNVKLDQFQYLSNVEKLCGYSHLQNHIEAAARERGFEFLQRNGRTLVRITDETIDGCIRLLDSSRKLHDDPMELKPGHDLRDLSAQDPLTQVYPFNSEQATKINLIFDKYSKILKMEGKRVRAGHVKPTVEESQTYRPKTYSLDEERIHIVLSERARKAPRHNNSRKQRPKLSITELEDAESSSDTNDE